MKMPVQIRLLAKAAPSIKEGSKAGTAALKCFYNYFCRKGSCVKRAQTYKILYKLFAWCAHQRKGTMCRGASTVYKIMVNNSYEPLRN